MKRNYDLIVAGAGAAGCLLAARIAEHGRRPGSGEPLRVALVEAGPYWRGDNRPGYGNPQRRAANCFINYEMDPALYWPWGRARMVGGSMMRYATFMVRRECLFDDDYQAWQQETGVDWTKERLREAVLETQTVRNLSFAPEAVLTRGNQLFLAAARDHGVDVQRMAIARTNCLFCGRCDSGHVCKYDARGNSQPYIDLAERLGVDIVADAEIQRVAIEKRNRVPTAYGVVVQRQGRSELLTGDKVMVSCGFMGSPVLLMKSGYGAKNKVPVPVLAENPNVGRHLEGDLNFPVHALFDEPIKPPGGASTGASYVRQDVMQGGEQRLILQDHGMSVITYPHEAALNDLAPAFGWAHKEYMRNAITRLGGLYPFIERPGLKGEVDVNGRTEFPGDDPRLLARMNDAIDLATALLKRMGAVKIAQRRPRRLSPWHQVGTCRAGLNRRDSVVNEHFESHDVKNLFVCDGSVLPRQGSTFVAAAIVTIAAFAARRIVARHFNG